jgi:hypothetical protein
MKFTTSKFTTSIRTLMIITMSAATLAFATPSADAFAACPSKVPVGHYCIIAVSRISQDSLTDLATYPKHENPGDPVGVCYASVGSTCSITVGESLTTTVATSLGFSKKLVAASMSFSLSRTSTISVSCSSPKLKKNQKYIAWRLGVTKLYRVSQNVSHVGGAKRTTSKRLLAWQPYKGIQVRCLVAKA